jgi:hypothetical protein
LVHYQISPDLLGYSSFKQGSYWIYKNEESTLTDSCYIKYEPIFSIMDSKREKGYLFEELSIRIQGSFLSSIDIQSSPDCDFATFAIYGSSSSFYSFRTNAPVGQIITESINTYQTKGIYNSFVLNDTVFRDVIQTRVAFLGNHGDSTVCEYYFAKKVGMIKYLRTSEAGIFSWSLIRWHAVQ